ncbi:MAG: DNA cytosine methyltransferase [Pirellulales bacterium]|nr:DNA cytosine methyltransferase [Pirellulales bacterium]
MPLLPEKTVCEFFAGIGLVHEGLRPGGWQCVYAGDIDPKKHDMHRGHYGASDLFHEGDIWNTAEVLERIAVPPALATASFPCTDMSLAGKRRGLAGAQSGALFGFLQVLEALADERPRMVLLENVPGFLTSHGGEDFAVAAHELADLGYWLDAFLVDARWFVPQSRPRMFVVGYHASILGPPLAIRRESPEWFAVDDAWQQAVRRSGKMRPVNLLRAIQRTELATGWATVDAGCPPQRQYELADFLDADEAQPWWDSVETDRHVAMMSPRHAREVESLVGDSRRVTLLTAFRRVREGQQRMEVRFDGVAGCLRTPRGGSAKQIVLAAGRGQLRLRWMTPREYARLQGAPEYTLPGNTIQALFGFGDAVCVPAIRWIDEHMLTPVWDGAVERAAQPPVSRRPAPIGAGASR